MNTPKKTKRLLPQKLTKGQMSLFFLEIEALLTAGVGISSAIDSLLAESAFQRNIDTLRRISVSVNDGTSLWKALEPNCSLSQVNLALLRIGEESGNLLQNIRLIIEQTQKASLLKNKIQTALLYPVIVFIVMVVVSIVLAVFVLPVLSSAYSNMRIELPLSTRMIIATGHFLGEYGVYAVSGLMIFVLGFVYLLFIHSSTKKYGQAIILKTPVIRTIFQQNEITQFGYMCGSLVESGLPITLAIRSVSDSTALEQYKRFYQYLYTEINNGSTFQQAFTGYPHAESLFPKNVQLIISNAENSGSLKTVFSKVASLYEIRSSTSASRLAVLIEPVLLFVVFLGVSFIAFSTITPIYSLMSSVSTLSDAPTVAISKPKISTTPTTTPTVSPSPTPSVITPQVTKAPLQKLVIGNNGGTVNIRSGPSTKYQILLKAKSGTEYSILDFDGEWYQIIIDEQQNGWVIKDYVSIKTTE
jgi:type II secretory pathway component PulF